MLMLIKLLIMAITLYIAVIVVSVILSWLIAFGVINRRNQLVYTVADACYRLTEPALRPLRQRLPTFSGVDISPLVLILALLFVRDVVLVSTSIPTFFWLTLNYIIMLITLYIWMIIISAILSWLIAFDVINRRNPLVYTIADGFYRITDPALRPIRKMLPDLGGLDVSPIIVIVGLIILREGISKLQAFIIFG
jgi:YggT family protein